MDPESEFVKLILMKVIGHRGFKAEYPENSLLGFQKAIQTGIKAIELDVHLTRDNQVVVTHDPQVTSRLFRTQSGDVISRPLAIHRTTYDFLKTFDYGSHRDEKTGVPRTQALGQKLPLLKQVLELDTDQETEWCVEVKYETSGYPDPDQLVSCVLNVINECEVADRSILFSFSPEILQIARKKQPDLRINFLYEGESLLGPLAKILKRNWAIPNWTYCDQVVRDLKADYFAPHYRLLELFQGWRTYFARDVRPCGLFTWTTNESKSWQRFCAEGELDGLVTDEPILLKNYIESSR